MMQESKMTTQGMFTESCFLTRGGMKASEGRRRVWKKTRCRECEGKTGQQSEPGGLSVHRDVYTVMLQ